MSSALAKQWLKVLAAVAAEAAVPPAPQLLVDFDFAGEDVPEDHFRLGLSMGRTFDAAIRERMAVKAEQLGPILASKEGRAAYEELLRQHEAHAPQLVQELRGIARGSAVAFETVFANSLFQELSYFNETREGEDHCTEYVLCNETLCIGGHNEDSNVEDVKLFVGDVTLGDSHFKFVNYVGDLPGGMSAVAFNKAGLAVTLNWVGPPNYDMAGLGRNYISRMLLDARTWEEMLAIACQPHVAGHNYQMYDFKQRRVANVETANDRCVITNISGAFYHTNTYLTLDVPGQTESPSALHRLQRLSELPTPVSAEEVLTVLGDQADQQWPIFHDQGSHDRGELSDWTLATVLLDLDRGQISLMDGSPAAHRVLRKFDVLKDEIVMMYA